MEGRGTSLTAQKVPTISTRITVRAVVDTVGPGDGCRGFGLPPSLLGGGAMMGRSRDGHNFLLSKQICSIQCEFIVAIIFIIITSWQMMKGLRLWLLGIKFYQKGQRMCVESKT